MNLQTNISEGSAMVEKLLRKQPVPIGGAAVMAMPEESGIYLFSNHSTGEFLYVGNSDKGLSGRMKDHWAGTTTSDFARALVREDLAPNLPESRDYIRENVVLRWLTREVSEMEIKWAEHFAIGALRPRLNR